MTFNFENLLKLALPVFILLGITEITAYYNEFNFSILEYLSFTEIITVFLNNIYIYVSFFLPTAILLFLKKDYQPATLILIACAFNLLYISTKLSGDFRFQNSSNLLIGVSIFLIVFCILTSIPKLKISEYLLSLETGSRRWLGAFFLLMISLLLTSLVGMWNAKEVKRHHIFNGTSIYIHGTEITSTDTSYYIGKSQSFVFYYNESDDFTTAYPVSEIEKIRNKTTIPQINLGGRPNDR